MRISLYEHIFKADMFLPSGFCLSPSYPSYMAESVEESLKVVAKCGYCIPGPLLCHAFLSAPVHLAFLSLKTVFNVCFECANRTHCKQMHSRRHILFVHSSRCSLRGGQIILCFADKAGCLLCPTVFGSATLSVLCPAQPRVAFFIACLTMELY